ncbi:MAG TPA: ATP-binding protein [Vicinamibacterales bacterium]|nr:ATP-binding protein [Vicinamibacterales bacterium]
MSAFLARFGRRRDRREAPPPDPATSLDALLAELVRQADLASLRFTMTARLAELSGCDRVELCQPIPGQPRFAARTGAGDGRPHFAARGPLARWLRVNETSLLLPDDRDVFEYLPADEQAELDQAEARVCLPAMLRGDLTAIVILGRPNGRVAGLEDRLDLLQRYADQAALVAERVAQAEADRERKQAQARVHQLAAAGQLAAAMAHEIRNPLSAIRAGLQYVATVPEVPAGDQELLAEVVVDLDRINRTISQVLGYSRPRDLQVETLDLVPIVRHALTLLGPHLRHNRIEVALDLPDTSRHVRADPHELQQVLVNVLLNACEACPSGGRIRVAIAGAGDIVPGGVAVVIADTGRGMTGEELARAFEPFFTTREQGTGLGLATCRQVMTRHGGDIRLASEKGRGTVATIVLPGADA